MVKVSLFYLSSFVATVTVKIVRTNFYIIHRITVKINTAINETAHSIVTKQVDKIFYLTLGYLITYYANYILIQPIKTLMNGNRNAPTVKMLNQVFII